MMMRCTQTLILFLALLLTPYFCAKLTGDQMRCRTLTTEVE